MSETENTKHIELPEENFEDWGIMIDWETLSLEENARPISVGVCHFAYDGRMGAQFSANIEITDPGMRRLFDVNDSTLRWWFEQSDEARAAIANGAATEDLFTVLQKLVEFITQHPAKYIWSMGATDFIWLNFALRVYGMEPYNWYYWRDVRTLRELLSKNKMDSWLNEMLLDSIPGTKHNALDDADFQAQIVQYAMARKTKLSQD